MSTIPHIDLGLCRLPILVRRNRRAARMTLRLSPDGQAARLSLPAWLPLREGLAFVESRRDWLLARLAAQPKQHPLGHGATIPLRGVLHRIQHAPEARRGVWVEAEVIYVSGLPEHLPRRLLDWLKSEARREISAQVGKFAAAAGVKPGRLSIRDTRSRWGSCNQRGDLSFCWRFVLAPSFVLDYVVAHEVAHMAELNHGPRFWGLVSQLIADVAGAKSWLRRHGAELHRYGR
jgi:predicted metal-dependent hydrolase